jgi:stage V sporulation protein D (sporulation-specific penicillin-binding protein)
MMQLGTAFCSVINGGYYYEPHVVKQIVDEDGNVIKNYDKILVRRTISQETSDTMREMLFQVVEEGTGKKAGVEGYTIGGKTGTAEKLPRGQGKYVLSFIGFAPVESPQVVVYCIVDEPAVDDPANSGAGSILFNMIAEDLLPYMNIYKTNDNYDIDLTDFEEETATPVFDGETTDDTTAGSTEEGSTEAGSTEATGTEEGTTEAQTEGSQTDTEAGSTAAE